MDPCDEAPCDDHEGIPEPSAEAHQRPSDKHQHGGPHQSPFSVQTHNLSQLIAPNYAEVYKDHQRKKVIFTSKTGK